MGGEFCGNINNLMQNAKNLRLSAFILINAIDRMALYEYDKNKQSSCAGGVMLEGKL